MLAAVSANTLPALQAAVEIRDRSDANCVQANELFCARWAIDNIDRQIAHNRIIPQKMDSASCRFEERDAAMAKTREIGMFDFRVGKRSVEITIRLEDGDSILTRVGDVNSSRDFIEEDRAGMLEHRLEISASHELKRRLRHLGCDRARKRIRRKQRSRIRSRAGRREAAREDEQQNKDGRTRHQIQNRFSGVQLS